jgi:hypothetical protein
MKQKLKRAYGFAKQTIDQLTSRNAVAAKKRPGLILFLGAAALISALYLGYRSMDGAGELIIQWVSVNIALSIKILWLSVLIVVALVGLRAISAAGAVIFESDDPKMQVPPVAPNPFDQKKS